MYFLTPIVTFSEVKVFPNTYSHPAKPVINLVISHLLISQPRPFESELLSGSEAPAQRDT